MASRSPGVKTIAARSGSNAPAKGVASCAAARNGTTIDRTSARTATRTGNFVAVTHIFSLVNRC